MKKLEFDGSYVNKPPFTKNYADRFLVFTHGKGCYLYDRQGKKYLDLSSGIAVNSFGHGRADFARIIAKQFKRLVHTSNLYTSDTTLALAARLVASSPLESDQPWREGFYPGYFGGVHLGNSGSEANETALKYARIYAKRKAKPNGHKILAFHNSFHGRTMGALSVTATAKYREPSEPLVPGVTFIPYNDIDALKKELSSEYCAVIVEPIQGEGGLTPMQPEFAQVLNELCTTYEVVLIADEIQSGMARTGTLFASQAMGLKPDVITLAKPLAGGLPASATLVRPAINDVIHPGDHGTTFGGNPVVAALACRVWDTITAPNFLENVRTLSEKTRSLLATMAGKHPSIGNLKGRGMLIGLEVRGASGQAIAAESMPVLIDLAREQGLIVLRSGANVLRLAPPLNIPDKDLEKGVELLDKTFSLFEQRVEFTKA